MRNKLQILLLLIFFTSSYSQVDVVYNNLVWSDEFDTNGAVNSTKWHHQTQLPSGGSWFNGEVQHYTDQLSNSFVNNGNLNIVAIKEPYTDQGVTKQYTSARLNSKFAFQYGRVDIRAKVPNGQGTWPALWLLGKNVNEDGGFFDDNFGTTSWPACGEIDIMEHGIFPGRPINYIGAAIHTPSSSGNTVNKGGIQASDIAQNYHIYSMNWSPNQITFLLDGVAFYTYNPLVKNASNWPFDAEQYLLLNVAMGGFAGSIPSNFTQASMIVDYVRVYQNTIIDTQSPTDFTASVGTVTGSTVELLMNANDNSGTIAYTISHAGGTFTVYNPSGIQKSVVIPNLTSNTNYSFSISATDMSGNTVINSPIQLEATTLSTIQCSGADTQATEGTFNLGYNYTFETIGNDVKITFELLDPKIGLVAFLRRQSPFNEIQMTNVTGQVFSETITGQTLGSSITYAVKFAFAGGLAVTRYITYVVGNDCALSISNAIQSNKQLIFPNPVIEVLHLELNDNLNKIALIDLVGKVYFQDYVNSVDSIDLFSLKPGVYVLKVENSLGINNYKITKK